MRCFQCQHDNASDARFCNQCAAPFAPVCSTCDRQNTAEAKFCNQCAAPLIAPPSAIGSVQSIRQEAESENRLHALLPDVLARLQREGRVTYRTLKYVFALDDALVEDIREELSLKRLAVDEEGKVLVWAGEPTTMDMLPTAPLLPPSVNERRRLSDAPTTPAELFSTDTPQDGFAIPPKPARSTREAERRQLTVMFCDLVGSTDLSGKLDPEDLREVIRAYQETAAEVIQRYEGHIAQYLGDGLLIYFGYPVAHEDDAQRAVHTGLGIVDAMDALNTRLAADYGIALAVRVGIHTGPVVVGAMGSGGRYENLALGETPNIAARLEGLAQSNGIVISPVTAQLVQRAFALEELGPHALKGVAEPMQRFRVLGPTAMPRDADESMPDDGVFLVGRDEEVGLLLRRWEQSKEGLGQVVLLSGEAGIGKSSLVATVRTQIAQEGYTRITFRCSPYHTNSALYPVITHLEQMLGFDRDDAPGTKLAKLEQALKKTHLPLEESVPLVATLLSVPLENRYPEPTLSPQQQRQQTLDTLVAWLMEASEQQPVLAVWEDVHWADPSTLEIVGLVLEQTPTVSMLHVLTFRPEFTPPWPSRSHMTPLTLHRLERPQVEALMTHLTGGKALPPEVVEHIVTKTDGVPLYVEELTKMLLASDLLQEETDQYVLTGPLTTVAIPDTLQDSLMARLDQMNTAKEVAQLGAVLGREFAYEMLQAIAPQDQAALQEGLAQLVEAELLYQRGRPPRARYIFKHALVQDAAYQSLLRSMRQQVHQRVARVLEARFPESAANQPELLAHHCTEAGLNERAVDYWYKAGQRAMVRSANREAISHLTTGLELLKMLPESPDRNQQELDMHMALGPALMGVKGTASTEVEHTYGRALELCEQIGDTARHFQILWGQRRFYSNRGELYTAREQGEKLIDLAQRQHDPARLVAAHVALGGTLFVMGDLTSAQRHLEQAIALIDPAQQRALAIDYGLSPWVHSVDNVAQVLWLLGYPEHAIQRSQEACAVARELRHTQSLVHALYFTAQLHVLRWEPRATFDYAQDCLTLSTEEGFSTWAVLASILRSWALFQQEQTEMGVAQMRQNMTAAMEQGQGLGREQYLSLLAGAYHAMGESDEGLRLLAEAQAYMEKNGGHWYKAETYRLQGELLLQLSLDNPAEAEACFHQAITIAQSQSAKSWELRAATSLARLWQSQDKRQEACDLLAPVYGWFTEGFDTADLKDAKALLDELV